jgi:hypothetical protein
MYLSRFNFTLPIDGNATEEVTLVGNNKIWNTGGAMTTAEFDPSNGGTPTAPGIVRRFNVDFANTVLPTGEAGIPIPKDRVLSRPYLQSVTISADLGREAIQEIGSMAPYFRYVRFPLEIRSEFQIVASDGDTINASDFAENTGCGNDYRNVKDKEVKLTLCAGTDNQGSLGLDLGSKNKLTSVNYSGGDTGGGNATVTYSFQSYNKFKMTLGGTFGETKWVDNAADTDNYTGGTTTTTTTTVDPGL